jgi:orotidine-5'-phosphate decarboxylase
VLDALAALNDGAEPLGSIGAVVGATIGATGHDLSKVNGPFLAPGIGAQGATAADLRTVFGDALPAVLASTSREVLGAGPSVSGLRAASKRALTACQGVLAGRFAG